MNALVAPPLSWDAYYLGLAQAVARKSKDPSTKVGCVIVDGDHRPLGIGYNGLPRHVPDLVSLLHDRERKYPAILHAESNALDFARGDVKGATLYVAPLPPCSRCAGRIIQRGVRRVVSAAPSAELLERWGADLELAAWMFAEAGVEQVLRDDLDQLVTELVLSLATGGVLEQVRERLGLTALETQLSGATAQLAILDRLVSADLDVDDGR